MFGVFVENQRIEMPGVPSKVGATKEDQPAKNEKQVERQLTIPRLLVRLLAQQFLMSDEQSLIRDRCLIDP
jgi:hypothetical protein